MAFPSIYGIIVNREIQHLVTIRIPGLEDIMKKIITAGGGILIIGLILLISSSLSPSLAMENREPEEYEYEYYYNDPDDAEGGNMTQDVIYTAGPLDRVQTSTAADDDSFKLPEEIDTDEYSLTVFVNKEYSLPSSYVPKELVIPDIKFYGNGPEEKKNMRKEAADALEKMFAAAEKDGVILYGVSGYRSYERQTEIYNKNIRMRGISVTSQISAYPGHSEHQTGLAIDISCGQLSGALSEKLAYTAEGKWVDENCHKYGFIIRYPKDKENITGYSYEPWHIRYIGTEIAEYLHDNDLTLEEYYNYKPSKDISEDIISDAATAEKVNTFHTPAPKKTAAPSRQNTADKKTDDSKKNSDASSVDKENVSSKHSKTDTYENDENYYDEDMFVEDDEEDIKPEKTAKPVKTVKPEKTAKPTSAPQTAAPAKPADEQTSSQSSQDSEQTEQQTDQQPSQPQTDLSSPDGSEGQAEPTPLM